MPVKISSIPTNSHSLGTFTSTHCSTIHRMETMQRNIRLFVHSWSIYKYNAGKRKITTVKFKVCKSVRHRTIQINHQLDATIFQFIILTLIYSSTCFSRFPAHHQELNDCSGSLWFYLRIVVTVVLCSWSGRLCCYIFASGWWFIWITTVNF